MGHYLIKVKYKSVQVRSLEYGTCKDCVMLEDLFIQVFRCEP